jgi:hypothetical protein
MTPHQKAQRGLADMRSAILELLEGHPNGLRNVDIADKLGIRSNYLGKNQDYLSWSVLGLLLNDGLVARSGRKYALPKYLGDVKS